MARPLLLLLLLAGFMAAAAALIDGDSEPLLGGTVADLASEALRARTEAVQEARAELSALSRQAATNAATLDADARALAKESAALFQDALGRATDANAELGRAAGQWSNVRAWLLLGVLWVSTRGEQGGSAKIGFVCTRFLPPSC